jgi:hypothetical protein
LNTSETTAERSRSRCRSPLGDSRRTSADSFSSRSVNGALALIGVVLVVQMWLVTATI